MYSEPRFLIGLLLFYSCHLIMLIFSWSLIQLEPRAPPQRTFYPSKDEWIHKMWCIQTMKTKLGHKKEWSSDLCYSVSEPWKHSMGKKPNMKRFYFIWFLLYQISRIGKSIEIVCTLVVARSWARCYTENRRSNGTPLQCSCLENPMDGGAW